MPGIFTPEKGFVEMEPVCKIEGVLIFADNNTRRILTREFTGADELTELGISYRDLDGILRSGSKIIPRR
jgi:hypothetical protein